MSIVPRNRISVQPQPAELWPDWTDEVSFSAVPDEDLVWVAQNLGCPEGEPPREPRLPFADWIEVEAATIRLKGTGAARWLAQELDDLAALARNLGAHTPDEMDRERTMQLQWGRERAEGWDDSDERYN